MLEYAQTAALPPPLFGGVALWGLSEYVDAVPLQCLRDSTEKGQTDNGGSSCSGNGTVISMETSSSSSSSSTKSKLHKEKKSRTGHTAQGKKLWKPPDSPQGQKKICSFKNLALSLSKNPALQRVFPQDVEEAAILLMRLSCGFIHS
ncbi:hypothetical protein GH714_036957 [Hevea brasiliensis]|uniref:Uncharacterized protein n=1 Tax=Hevea brasiliensis TaxID=3981 RepID=A0A6A6KHK0_HEVBR|nr:hypothetical protein GH714_036957 [Hevea brasiliensis]